jgi:capsular exopolysaccharide synthesis family protein
VEQKEREANVKVVGVSSPAKGDGKTTTAINLAASIAQDASMRVLLIDMDLRNPSVSRKLGLSNGDAPGLVSAILNPNIDLDQILIRCTSNLVIIPAGARPASPYEILKARRLSTLLAEARSRFDHIIIDAAPLVPFPDCRLMAEIADRILLVVSAHKTPRKLLEESIKVVPPDKMLGIVYNTDDRFDQKYYYNYATKPQKRQSLLRKLNPFKRDHGTMRP